MKNHDNVLPEINFENSKETSQFFTLIKTEYLKKLYQTYFWLIMLIVMYVVYQLFVNPFNQRYTLFIFDQIIIWVLLSLYLLIHFFTLSYVRFSPTIIDFIENELHVLGYKFQRKYKIRTSNFLFYCFSIIIFIFATAGIYYSSNNFIISLILRLIIIYIFTSISIPILRGRLHDNFQVNLRNSYFIQIELHFNLVKHKEVESQMVRIYMTSNKLCPKSDQAGFRLYNEVVEKRWLQRKDNRILLSFLSRNYLFFRESATLINFNQQFLNLVSAIREWDISNDN